jgi:polysaccharide export outer membrane protein
MGRAAWITASGDCTAARNRARPPKGSERTEHRAVQPDCAKPLPRRYLAAALDLPAAERHLCFASQSTLQCSAPDSARKGERTAMNQTWDLLRQPIAERVARQRRWKALWRPFVALLAIQLGSLSVGAVGGVLSAQQPAPAPPPTTQQPPPRPPNVTDQQIQQAVQQGATPAMIQQRIQQSGLAPAEIRARLEAAGYSPSLLDAYMGGAAPGQAAGPPGANVNAALAALGMGPLGEAAVEAPPETRSSTSAAPSAPPALAPFGSDLFARASSQFQPLLTGPVDPDYRLGPGDQFVLILTGDVELAHSLEVTREGFVVIPQVGQIWVNGLTLAQLTDVLYARLGRVYSGVKRGTGATTRFQVSISRLRMNQIFVIGEVNRPGAYQVPSVGTVFYALYLAGGPNGNGSYRDITVRRGDRIITRLDIYDYLLRGDNSNDIRLESGDVVFVPVRARQVGIQGNVVRPALYELKPQDGLQQLVRLAGGVAPDAYVRRVQVDRVLPPAERTQPGTDRVLLDVDVSGVLDSTRANVPLEPNDVVSVFAVLGARRNYVTIRGNVFRPGTYEFKPGMHLWDLIQETRGLLSDTYVERAHIVRLQPDLTRLLMPVSLQTDSTGKPRENPELEDQDEIGIYARSDFRPSRTVTLSGAVRRPGTYPFIEAMTLRDLLIAAGGLRDDAYLRDAEVARLPVSRTGGVLADTVHVPLDSTYIVDRDSSRYLGPPGLPGRASGAPEFSLEPFDNVLILPQPGWELQRSVVVAGQVRYPGRYALLNRGERLADIIRRAGGLTEVAYAPGAQFTRAEGGLGRVGIDLQNALKDPRSRDNVVLFGGDAVLVPEYQPTVKVEGAVGSPVTVAYVPRRGVGYYIDHAGGFARQADKNRTYIVQPNGAVDTYDNRVQPGARVVVPAVPAGEEKTNWASVLGSVATILTSALTIILVVQRL